MRPTLALTAIEAVALPHRGGHRCDDQKWYNTQAGTRTPCPVLRHLETARLGVERLHTQVHEAAHDTAAARYVAEGMTGLELAALVDQEEAEAWTLTGRLAIEALAEWLDRDPVLEAKAAALRERLAAAGLAPDPREDTTP